MIGRRKKIGVVGGGNVGASCALDCAQRELGDVVMLDIVPDMPQGKCLDMFQSAPIGRFDAKLTGANDPASLEGCDVVVVTSGMPRKPGMSRDDLLTKNAEIIGSVSENIKKHCPDAIVIMVANPLDVMCWHLHKKTGLKKQRVIGMAGVLDSSRMAAFVAMELDVSIKDINAMVLGGHGDTMVPLSRFTTVSGIPITELIAKDRIEAINQRTRQGGAEIVALLKQGSAYYAPGSAAALMAESIVKDQKRVLPCCALLEGEYGIKDNWVGVPCKLGQNGIEKIIELKLTDAEATELKKSSEAVRGTIDALKKLL
ncbi:MAG: malate dehydrogenase [Planctomycetes bacterium]|nr:malate dehydrogenase [Planctomycetota bacterium]NUQ34743.1 malate dehydrogenase [Planctomycetaceae bacterium]